MHPTQTGIAVALALAVVIMFFILPGLFLSVTQPPQTAQVPALPTDNQGQPVSNNMSLENVTELLIADEVVGTGAVAEAGNSVTVHYIGRLTDGKVFDASRNRGDEGFTFTLGAGQVIRGWDQGVAGMREGGVRTLVIPASLAYGDQGVGGVIPPNATLVFQVELLKVARGGQ